MSVGRIQVDAVSFDDIVGRVVSCAVQPLGPVRLVNAWCVVLADDDEQYREVANGPGLNLPDGAPVLWLMRRSHRDAQRVRGPSLFVAGLEKGRAEGLRHFFLGGDEDTNRRVVERAARDFPGIRIAGAWSPPYGPVGPDLIEESIHRVRESGAEVVWIGLGAPKQDVLAHAICARAGMTALGVGAAFDFFAGTVPEAPGWMQRLGLEWVFRFATEPRRLWRRYVIGNLRFIMIAARR